MRSYIKYTVLNKYNTKKKKIKNTLVNAGKCSAKKGYAEQAREGGMVYLRCRLTSISRT